MGLKLNEKEIEYGFVKNMEEAERYTEQARKNLNGLAIPNNYPYLKTLSNTEKDINDIKISYYPINREEFNYLLENYTLLKIYIWKNTDDTVKNVLLYSSNNIPLEIEHY